MFLGVLASVSLAMVGASARGMPEGATHRASSGGWKAVATVPVYSIDQPAVHRYKNTLVIAWVQPGTHSGQVLMTRRYDARTGAKRGGTHKVMPAWAALNDQPQLTFHNGQKMLVFAGIRTAVGVDPYQASLPYYLTSGDAKSWVLQFGSLAHTQGVAASSGLAAINDANTPVVAFALSPNGWITYHQGISATIPATEPDGTTVHDTKCCVYDPGLGRDAKSHRVWVAWYTNSPHAGWNGVNAEGVPSGKRHHAPGSSTKFHGSQLSVSPNQTIQLASRPAKNHGGVYTAYAIGYPSPTTIGLWKLGASKTALRIHTGHLVADVGVAPATGGRLWIYWEDRATRDVKAALTNTKATKIASTHTLTPPGSSNTAFNLVGDGSKGRLNLVAVWGGTSTRLFYRQVKP